METITNKLNELVFRTRLSIFGSSPGEGPARLCNPRRSGRVCRLQCLLSLHPAALQPQEATSPGCANHGPVFLPLWQGGRFFRSKSPKGVLSFRCPGRPRTGRSTQPPLLLPPRLEDACSRVNLRSNCTQCQDCGRAGCQPWSIPMASQPWLPKERSW